MIRGQKIDRGEIGAEKRESNFKVESYVKVKEGWTTLVNEWWDSQDTSLHYGEVTDRELQPRYASKE